MSFILSDAFFSIDSRLIIQADLVKYSFTGSLLVPIAVSLIVDRSATCIASTEPCDDSTDFGIAPTNGWSARGGVFLTCVSVSALSCAIFSQ